MVNNLLGVKRKNREKFSFSRFSFFDVFRLTILYILYIINTYTMQAN